MIVFDLKCVCGCQFDGWFQSRADFDCQKDSGLLTCPACGCDDIHKILSPVAAIHAKSELPETAPPPAVPPDKDEVTPDQALEYLRSVQDYVEKNFEDVGPKLAKESLKIHYGVAKKRNIRGVATEDEEKMLNDEGIELLKIPLVKKPSDSKPN